MKKKLLLGTVAAFLVIAFAVPAFAAISDSQQKEIDGLLNQFTELRKQIVDKYVETGSLTQDQGDYIKNNIDQAKEYQGEYGTFGPGVGCGGPGMMYGGGFRGGNGYGMMGGYGYNMMGF